MPLKYAQDLVPNASGQYAGGFNARIMGYDYEHGVSNNYDIGNRAAGFWHADKMHKSGKCFAVHVFQHEGYGAICSGIAFPYGGTFVCNKCGKSRLEKHWWEVVTTMDGNAHFVHGQGFENLQESDNFAFGDTRDEALNKYQEKMMAKESL